MGISEAIAKYAIDDLKDFSFEVHGESIGKGLGLDRFVKQWGVSPDEYNRYWALVDKRVKQVFKKGDLEKRFQIQSVTAVSPPKFVESTFVQGFWETVGKFCSYVAIGLGGLAGGPIGVAGIIAGCAYIAGEDDE